MKTNERIGNWLVTKESKFGDKWNEFVLLRYEVPDNNVRATTCDGEIFYVVAYSNSGLYGTPISYKLTKEMFLEYPKEGTDYSKYKG